VTIGAKPLFRLTLTPRAARLLPFCITGETPAIQPHSSRVGKTLTTPKNPVLRLRAVNAVLKIVAF
jgi:hypothetical protein